VKVLASLSCVVVSSGFVENVPMMAMTLFVTMVIVFVV
jgi:hypothetical protein